MAYSSKRKRRRGNPGVWGTARGGRGRPAAPKPPRTPSASHPRFTPQAQSPRVPSAGDVQLGVGQQSGGYAAGYDISSDPAVMAAHGLAAKIRARATASALAKRKQAAIEYGDPTGVEGIDAATSKAATENPFSVLKNLAHSYETGTRDLEEGLLQSNLFYSGYRGQQLGEAARGYQGARYQAGTNFRGLMSDINDRLAEALLNADAMEASSIMGSDGGGYGGDYGGDSGSGDTGVQYAYNHPRSFPTSALRLTSALSGTRRITGTARRRRRGGRGKAR